MKAPLRRVVTVVIPALGTDVEGNTVAFEAEFAGKILNVGHIPIAAITGASTNHRKISVINKGSGGLGAVEMAALAYDNGVTAAAYDKKNVPVSGTAADLEFAEGDVIVVYSSTPGSGIADPGGAVLIKIERSVSE